MVFLDVAIVAELFDELGNETCPPHLVIGA